MKVGDNNYLLIYSVYQNFLGKQLKRQLKLFNDKELKEFRKVHNNYMDTFLPYIIISINNDKGEHITFNCYDTNVHSWVNKVVPGKYYEFNEQEKLYLNNYYQEHVLNN